MPKKGQPGKQFKVWLPEPLASCVEQDAGDTGRSRAEVIRSIVAQHYQRLARAASLGVEIVADVALPHPIG